MKRYSVVGALQRREGEALAPDPGPVPLGPVAALAVDPAVAGQELPQAMAPAQEILLDIFPAPEEIAGGFRGLIGHGIGVSSPARKRRTSLRGIPPVGLDPVARACAASGRGP